MTYLLSISDRGERSTIRFRSLTMALTEIEILLEMPIKTYYSTQHGVERPWSSHVDHITNYINNGSSVMFRGDDGRTFSLRKVEG